MTTSQVKSLVDTGKLDLSKVSEKYRDRTGKDHGLKEAEMISVLSTVIGSDGKFSLTRLVKAVEDKQAKVASTVTETLMEATDKADKKSVAITATSSRLINEVVNLLEKDSTIHDHVVQLTDAQGTVKSTPIMIYRDMDRLLGSKMDEMPVPGTSYKHGDNNPDVRRVMRKAKDGSSQPKDVSWYSELRDALAFGKFLIAQKEAIGAASRNENIVDKRFVSYAGLGSEQLLGESRKVDVAANNLLRTIKSAVNLHVQIARVSSKLPHIRVKLSEDTASQAPVFLSDINNADKFRAVTLSGFLRLNVNKAEEKGGSFESFLASSQVEPETGRNAKAMTIKDADESISSWAIFLTDPNRFLELDKFLGEKDNEDERISFEAIYLKFDALYSKHKALIARERKARQAQAEAAATAKQEDAA